jgi:RND family efflux transporter, MFP subunit
MNKTVKWTILGLIVLIVFGLIIYPKAKEYFNTEKTSEESGKPQAPSGRNAPLSVNVKVLEYETLTDIIPATGNLIPDEQVDLSFETSGKVTQIYFKEGAHVVKGELLAKVNDKPLQAELHKLKTQLPLAEERVYRHETLLHKDAVSKEAYEQVVTELEKLKADIELVQTRIAQTELRAPFSGSVGLRHVSEGAYASPTTIITTLTRIIPLKIEFSVNETYSNDLKAGTKISFTTDNASEVNEAVVYAVDSKVDIDTRSMVARAIYPNTNGKLKPGGMAYIEIKLREEDDALFIPAEAIIQELGKTIVYVYDNGKAKLVEVEKGQRTANNISIPKGLHPGDTVIVSGTMQLRRDMPVEINEIIR